MSLSKPEPPTYSTFETFHRSHYEVILANYPHHRYLKDMGFYYLRKIKIVTPELMSLIAGNYCPETYRRIDVELAAEKSASRDVIYYNFKEACNHLDIVLGQEQMMKDRGSDLSPEEKREKDHWMRELPLYIQNNVLPTLLRMDQYNREHYEPFRFPNFMASLASCSGFQELARLFIMHFFQFTCYSDRTQRMKVLEVAVRKGRELLPSLPPTMFRQEMLCDEHCNCCLWLILQYHDFAKRTKFNLSYKMGPHMQMLTDTWGELLLHIDDLQTDLLEPLGQKRPPPVPTRFKNCQTRLAGRYNVEAVPPKFVPKQLKAVDITIDMLRRQPLLSYTLYALDFLSLDDLTLSLEQARTNDILVHMAPLFSFEYECAIAFASGLHPRLGGTREIAKMVQVKEQEGAPKTKRPQNERVVLSVGSPLFLLDEGILQKIWEHTEVHFRANAGPIPRLKFKAGAKRVGRRELAGLRKLTGPRK